MSRRIFKTLSSYLGITAIIAVQTVGILGSAAPRRISTLEDGTQTNQGPNFWCPRGSCFPSISGDGRYVAFASDSTNLVQNDTNATTDIFVKDRATGAIVRASTAADGTQGNNASCSVVGAGSVDPSLSADGRYVAFVSCSSNLVPNDTGGFADVFVKDLQTGAVTLASTSPSGQANSGTRLYPQISGSGRYVVFATSANNLLGSCGNPPAPCDNNNASDIYRKDLQTDTLSLVSHVSGSATQPGNNSNFTPVINFDGRYVAYLSAASNILVPDTNNNQDVVVTDMNDGTHRNASLMPNGTQTPGILGSGAADETISIDITPDGRYVAFTSRDTLVPEDLDSGFADIYLRDMQANTTTFVSTAGVSGGPSAQNGNINPRLNDDGRYVEYGSIGVNGLTQTLFFADRQTDTIREVILYRNGGTTGGSISGFKQAVMSRDGRFVAFMTDSNILVPNDTNLASDIYTVDLRNNAPAQRVQGNYDGDTLADISVFRPADGNWYYLRGSDGSFGAAHWGTNGDKPAAGDYDGDGKTDHAVFRASEGMWFVLRSSDGTFLSLPFGISEDVPVAADYDGDGATNLAVFRPSVSTWYYGRDLITPGTNFVAIPFGAFGDKPVTGDYDGDGRADAAVFRPSNRTWYLLDSSRVDPAGFRGLQFGATGDLLAPADYNNDGHTDIAVYRPSTGTWFIGNSRRNCTGCPGTAPTTVFYEFSATRFGVAEDVPVPADYDGDGRADVSVFRPSTGTWWLTRTTTGQVLGSVFGASGDVPIPFAAESN